MRGVYAQSLDCELRHLPTLNLCWQGTMVATDDIVVDQIGYYRARADEYDE
jgi:hypothetical protein